MDDTPPSPAPPGVRRFVDDATTGRDDAEHHNQRGVVYAERGDLTEALRCFERATSLRPDFIEGRYHLALTLAQTGATERAVVELETLIAQVPEHAAFHHAAGAMLMDLGRLDPARARLETAARLAPAAASARAAHGRVLAQLGKLPDAVRELRAAVELAPEAPSFHNDLGVALLRLGDTAGALVALRRAVALAPAYTQATQNLAGALRRKGDLAEALAACREGLAARPDDAALHVLAGSLLVDLRQSARSLHPVTVARTKALSYDRAAEEHLAAAQAISPRTSDLHEQWAHLHRARGAFVLAARHYRDALQVTPRAWQLHAELGLTLAELGRVEDAVAALQQAVQFSAPPSVHSMLLLFLHYVDGFSAAQIYDAHQRYGARITVAPLEQRATSETHGRIRVGYLSPDFRRHSVALFIEHVIAAHDRASFEVYCYSNVERPDEVTGRISDHADHFRPLRELDDSSAAALIRDDEIDVLVDLAGHTGGNRLGVLALKPAPVQVTYLGYPNTTGLASVDYRLTDEHADPPGDSDALHAEQLVRLEGGFLCFRAPDDAPAVSPAPSVGTGRVTFASFNRLLKITPAMKRMWAGILRQMPGSRLLIKSEAFASADVRAEFLAEFAESGVARDRIVLRPWLTTMREHLSAYAEVDVALDCFPYNGTTTTCEALYMGVPVVTLAGSTHVSRVGESLLRRVGLTSLVARSADDYGAGAVALARDSQRRIALRTELRERVQRGLCDTVQFTRRLEAAYRAMQAASRSS